MGTETGTKELYMGPRNTYTLSTYTRLKRTKSVPKISVELYKTSPEYFLHA